MKKTNIMITSAISIMSLAFMGFWLPTNEKHDQMQVVSYKGNQQKNQNRLYLEAVRRGDVAGVKQALKEGADINAVDENHASALHLIAQRSRPNYQKYAISAGNEIFFEVEKGRWEGVDVVKAQEQRFYHILNILLEMGIDIFTQDGQGLIAQDYAAQNNDYIMVRRIIDAEKARKIAQAKGK